MKPAAALSESSKLQSSLQKLEMRLNNNVKGQEGEPPAEEAMLLLQKMDETLKRLEERICRINRTNSMTGEDIDSLTAMPAEELCCRNACR